MIWFHLIVPAKIVRNRHKPAYGLLKRKNWLPLEMVLVSIHWFPTSTGSGLAAFQEAPGPRLAEALSESPLE